MLKGEIVLRTKFSEAMEEAENARVAGKVDEWRAALDQAEEYKNQLELFLRAQELELPEPKQALPTPLAGNGEDEARTGLTDKEVRSAFYKAVRGESVTKEERAAIMSNTENGPGLTIPVDVNTKIKELKRTLNPLEQFVNVEHVATATGSRVIEKLGAMTPFQDVAEGVAIPDVNSPQFETVKYAVKKYGGIMTLTQELLQDSDENLEAYIVNWFAKKDVVTKNHFIIKCLKDNLTKATIGNLEDIKSVYNVALDPAHAAAAVIITNQDGLQFLDALKDGDGRGLLQPDPTDATRRVLFGTVPVHVMSKQSLPTENKKVPFIFGDVREAVTVYDRMQEQIDVTDRAGDAWSTWGYSLRALLRFDVQPVDKAAAVYGEITLD